MGRTERGQWYWYETIADEAVRPACLVPLARSVAEWAGRDLALASPLMVVWFTRHRQMMPVPPSVLGGSSLTAKEHVELFLNMNAPPTLYGRFMAMTPSTIYLRARRTPDYLVMDLLHEARHAWQHAHGQGTAGEHDEMEMWKRQSDADAEDYVKRTYLSIIPMIRQHVLADRRRAMRGQEGGAG